MDASVTRLRERGSGGTTCSLEGEKRFMAQRHCPNMNHRRSNSPVAFCPACGEVVNPAIPRRSCSEGSHAKQRKGGNLYCVDCGEPLRVER